MSRASARPPESGGLRARHKRDKLERLRQAAWDLFTTQGYERTTTREIAERAGIAAGTVFLYAKDKADLLFLVLEQRLSDTVEEAFRSLPAEGPLPTQLMHIFQRIFAMYDKAPAIARQFIKELPGADGPNAQRVSGMTFAFLQQIGGLIERAQERGEVRSDVAPLLGAQVCFAVYYMALMSWLSGFNTLETALDPTLKEAITLMMRGLERR